MGFFQLASFLSLFLPIICLFLKLCPPHSQGIGHRRNLAMGQLPPIFPVREMLLPGTAALGSAAGPSHLENTVKLCKSLAAEWLMQEEVLLRVSTMPAPPGRGVQSHRGCAGAPSSMPTTCCWCHQLVPPTVPILLASFQPNQS